MEVTNPIGSYVNTHKLGCLFCTLGNIQPMYRSPFKAIFLGVALSQDIDHYGIDTFLKPDLKSLYIDSITIGAGGRESTYHDAFWADTQATWGVKRECILCSSNL